ncbi:MAG TPA: phosphonoacetate hydrolase [Rhodospirillales bacterium]|nr:phosphonoacetate hydrolase [Rhodospirillales bacterium]
MVAPSGDTFAIELNGRGYRWPRRPVVVVCIDGCDPAYLEDGFRRGALANMARFTERGFSAVAEAVVPTFTNPNNVSIVTGSPAAVHGISGNFFLDPESGAAVSMTDPALMRSDTLLAAFAGAGARVAAITAKEKLRRLLGRGIEGHPCFSAECAGACSRSENGIEGVLELAGMPQPDVYSAELSYFVLEAGIALLERDRVELMYLSLTDFVQHKYAPGEPEAVAFYETLHAAFGRLADLGAVVGLTADHGMNDKARTDGSPNVTFLQDALDDAFGTGSTRVICTITDPYVVHHGALGSFVSVYCRDGAEPEAVARHVTTLPGVESVFDRAGASSRFELPSDRIGDLVVIGDRGTVLGAAETEHDLTGLAGHRLRSHGGTAERAVPLILSEPLSPPYRMRAAGARLRNFDIFDFAINGVD